MPTSKQKLRKLRRSAQIQVSKLCLKPGDVLVLKVSKAAGTGAFKRIADQLRGICPAGCVVAVIPNGQTMEVMSNDESFFQHMARRRLDILCHRRHAATAQGNLRSALNAQREELALKAFFSVKGY